MTYETDLTDTKITYKAIQDRAMSDAKEYMPDFPTVSTVEAWEDFMSEVESVDDYEVAYESSEWDWVIYYHRAMELCKAVPTSVLNEAESEWVDMDYGVAEDFGLYEFAATLASIIVTREIASAAQDVREDLIELAESQLENL